MKNVCFFNSIKFWGGGEKLHLEYAVEFKKKNYNVFLAANKKALLTEKGKAQGLKTHPIKITNRSFLNIFKIIQLILFYRKNQIDTVVFSASQDVKVGSISAKLAGVKNIVYLRGLAVPVKASFMNRLIFKSMLTHIVANSEETKKHVLKDLGKYINTEKVYVIYHGIEVHDVNTSRKIKEIEKQGHGIILGNAGRLTPQKGQDKLIEIAKKIKEQNVEFTLFIAGTGELEDSLKVKIKEYGLEKEVILLGFVKDMEAFMNSIDVFLLTSVWEGFGYVLVEAMLKSSPVVAFNMTSNPEIVTANKTGFLVDYPNTDDFANKTVDLITNNILRKSIGEKAKESVFNRFDLEDRITEFEYCLLGKVFEK